MIADWYRPGESLVVASTTGMGARTAHDKLGFERQRLKPECLRRYEATTSVA